MARRRTRSEANIWPGFVDGLSTLLLVLMFVLSIFVVAQFYLGDRLQTVKDELASKDDELARLIAQINSLNDQLGLAQSERERLQAQVLSLEDTIAQKDAELAGLGAALATSQAAVAASAEELEAEKGPFRRTKKRNRDAQRPDRSPAPTASKHSGSARSCRSQGPRTAGADRKPFPTPQRRACPQGAGATGSALAFL